MHYEFKTRSPQKYPSWVESWANFIVDTSPAFQFMLGWQLPRALVWVNNHAYNAKFGIDWYDHWTVQETTLPEARKLYRLFRDAGAIAACESL